MLKFIDENDFLLVDTFKENEDGTVSWVWDEGEGLPTHSGVIREGFKRYTQEQQGTEEVAVRQEPVLDEGGNPTYYEDTGEQIFEDITEEQPVMVDVEIDVWAKLLELEQKELVSVKWLTTEDHEAIAQERQRVSFKSERQRKLDAAVVTTSNGLKFDADERSITRMANAISAAERAGRTDVRWSLADTATGVMTDITLQDLQEAHTLAVENMESIWEV